MSNKVKRTERGWAGHFIAADRCMFRRNTLLEYKDRKWVVSTIGNYHPSLYGTVDTIGHERWYETMVFEASCQGGYLGYLGQDVGGCRKNVFTSRQCGK